MFLQLAPSCSFSGEKDRVAFKNPKLRLLGKGLLFNLSQRVFNKDSQRGGRERKGEKKENWGWRKADVRGVLTGRTTQMEVLVPTTWVLKLMSPR